MSLGEALAAEPFQTEFRESSVAFHVTKSRVNALSQVCILLANHNCVRACRIRQNAIEYQIIVSLRKISRNGRIIDDCIELARNERSVEFLVGF